MCPAETLGQDTIKYFQSRFCGIFTAYFLASYLCTFYREVELCPLHHWPEKILKVSILQVTSFHDETSCEIFLQITLYSYCILFGSEFCTFQRKSKNTSREMPIQLSKNSSTCLSRTAWLSNAEKDQITRHEKQFTATIQRCKNAPTRKCSICIAIATRVNCVSMSMVPFDT